MKSLIIFALFTGMMFAADAPKPKTPALSEIQTLKLEAAYKNYLLAVKDQQILQAQEALAQRKVDDAVSAWTPLAESIRAEAGYPVGTKLQPDSSTGHINVLPPDPPKEKK